MGSGTLSEATISSIVPPLHRRDTTELLDDPQSVLPHLSANLGDLRRINRWFGGVSIVLRHLDRLMLPGSDCTVLDVATGSADIPLAICCWAETRAIDARVTAIDVSAEVLNEARRHVSADVVELVQADARSLPWDDNTFDYVICSLALHHFEPREAVRVLSEMWRVAATGVVVSDLVRGRAAYAGTWLLTHTLAASKLTRHDGPLSVLRAYTPAELRELAEEAGLARVRLYRHAPFRQVLVATRGPSARA